jgi:hypothetical protein
MPRNTLDESLLAQYRGLVIKLAWQYWRRLPVSTKMWVEPEDLIEDAYLFILTRHAQTYNNKRAMRSTFLWTGIGNLFLNFALSQQTRKRFGWPVPLEEVETMGRRDDRIQRVESVDAIIRIFNQASPECQVEMRRWFGFERPKVRRSEQGRRIYKEFSELAYQNRVSPDDCRKLMRSGLCL